MHVIFVERTREKKPDINVLQMSCMHFDKSTFNSSLPKNSYFLQSYIAISDLNQIKCTQFIEIWLYLETDLFQIRFI